MKKLNFFLLTALATIAVSAQAFAQQVTGNVRDEAGLPIIGATVVVDGTTVGTTTDVDGHFAIRIPEGGTSLTATFLGYDAQTLAVGGGFRSMTSCCASRR